MTGPSISERLSQVETLIALASAKRREARALRKQTLWAEADGLELEGLDFECAACSILTEVKGMASFDYEMPAPSISLSDAARIVDLHPATLRRAVIAGKLPARNLGGSRGYVVTRAALEAWTKGG